MKPLDLPKRHKAITFLIVAFLFLSPAILQGCDTFSEMDHEENSLAHEPASVQQAKLRHPGLLEAARRSTTSKSASTTTDLFLALNPYEADGITPRLLNKFEVTGRILEEYGITRRILDKYGVTRRILDKYGVTRRILNQYDVTRRILDKYGLVSRFGLVSRYGGQVTAELLAEAGVTLEMLEQDGISEKDLADFNKLSAVLMEFGLTVEEFAKELEAFICSIRIKIYIDGAHLGIAISIDSAVLEAFFEEIMDDEDILFAEPDVTIDLSDFGTISDSWQRNQITPWGITQSATPIPSEDDLWTEDYILENPVHVYILDSGASMKSGKWSDLQYYEKQDFTMLFENPEQLLWEEDLARDVSGFDPDFQGNPYDESGHGSHIAGTIGATNDDLGVVGVAPAVILHSLKVLTAEGRTDVTTLLAAVDFVTRAKLVNPEQPMVVNMSLGMDIGTTSYNVLDEAIEHSIAAGVIYVVAAGNDGRDAATYSPAHVENVITVGAYNEKGLFSSFSNYGSTVDIMAPGENIISLSHIIEETKQFEAILASGTSYAAPHVTGAVARYLGGNPKATALQVEKALKASATATVNGIPAGTANKALNVGNLLAAPQASSLDEPKYLDESIILDSKSKRN